MSEGVKTSANGGGFRFKVRGPRDFYGGLALIALAIVAIWTSGDLPGMHGFAFGPGTAPRLFAGLLAVVGALVALTGLFIDGPPIGHFAIKGPAYVLAGILLFAGMIRGLDLRFIGIPFTIPPLGLVLSTFAAFMVSIMRLERDALGGKPDCRRGDDRVLRRSVRLFAAAAVPALALDLSRKTRHE